MILTHVGVCATPPAGWSATEPFELDATQLPAHMLFASDHERVAAKLTFDGRLQCSLLCEAAGLETVSVEPATRSPVGLHVDDWEPGHVLARSQPVCRLDINLGPEARGLVFVPRSLSSMDDALRERLGYEVHGGRRARSRAYLASFPEQPVLRLRVPPGYAYLAPVDRVVHDGTTADCSVAVRHVAIEGSVGFRTQQRVEGA